MPTFARKHQLQNAIIYHVTNRGNRREDVFHVREDYLYFKRLLSEYVERFKLSIYHWVLMPNHYHLLVELDEPERLSKAMAGLGRAYVHYYQRTYNLGGHIWQGRFKSQPIEKEAYLLTCGRYIERNPVKAMMVARCEDYEFSSVRFYVTGAPDDVTIEEPLFPTFGKELVQRRKSYAEYLMTEDEKAERLFEGDKPPVGSPEFKRRLIVKNSRYLPRRKGAPRKNTHI